MMTVLEEVATVPSSPSHEIEKVVCAIIGAEVNVPELPVHESPLLPVTVHEFTYFAFHFTVVVSPFNTRLGKVLKVEMVAVGAPLHDEPVQPYLQVWTREPEQAS